MPSTVFVFRDNQPTDVALELLKSLRRKHRREKRSIVLYNSGNFPLTGT